MDIASVLEDIMVLMADQATPKPKKREPKRYPAVSQALKEATVVGHPTNSREQLTSVQVRAARMMAKGQKLPVIAQKLADWIIPNEPDRQKQLKKTRSRLRSWVRSQAFRDAIWEEAVTALDARTGEILEGVARKAAAGRVDAARLGLEVTGRHSPHTEIQPATVNVVFGDVPRPQSPKQIEDAEVIDMDAEVDPDED